MKPFVASLCLFTTVAFGASRFPHVGMIEADEGTCTGTLIAPTWVITAGHCVDDKRAELYRFTTAANPNEGNPEYFKGALVALHPEFDTKYETPGVDVALLKLETPSPAFDAAKAFPLSSDVIQLGNYQELMNVGYGENFDDPGGYRRVKDLKFDEYFDLPAKTQTFLRGGISVTRGKTGEIGCQGDSGSPLIMLRSGVYSLMGIYSTSEKNAADESAKDCKKNGDSQGNYIATPTFVTWVNETIKN